MNTTASTSSSAVPAAGPLQAGRLAKARARRRVNAVALTLSMAAMAFGLFWLIWILIETFRLGLGGLSWTVLTEMTPAPQAEATRFREGFLHVRTDGRRM